MRVGIGEDGLSVPRRGSPRGGPVRCTLLAPFATLGSAATEASRNVPRTIPTFSGRVTKETQVAGFFCLFFKGEGGELSWSIDPSLGARDSRGVTIEICSCSWSLVPTPARHQVENLVPYWLAREEAVPNSFDFRGLFLLTAPNMSGKSTLMRAVLAAALLANAGLFVPCSEATFPR